MLNFAVGPVQMDAHVRAIGGGEIPYFRTSEFSEVMIENERLLRRFLKAPSGSRGVFLTGSGTAAMEAAVINTLTPKDTAVVVNGGSFGQRFVELCSCYGIPFHEILLGTGKALRASDLEPFEGRGCTALLVNVHETSTGVLYDMGLIADFCRRNDVLCIADDISSFLADPFDMAGLGVDVVVTSSQKALACPPGLSMLVMSERALRRVGQARPRTMYLDLSSALRDAERGQTPFTPAVGILLQVNARLRDIDRAGGVEAETARVAALAAYFRRGIGDLPFRMISESPSNALTALHPLTIPAHVLFETLKEEYGIWACPNGGALRDVMFRVGHLGAVTTDDIDVLLRAFRDMRCRRLI